MSKRVEAEKPGRRMGRSEIKGRTGKVGEWSGVQNDKTSHTKNNRKKIWEVKADTRLAEVRWSPMGKKKPPEGQGGRIGGPRSYLEGRGKSLRGRT